MAIEGGYFQTHSTLKELRLDIVNFDATLEKGDVYFLETPSNPYCICRDIKEVRKIEFLIDSPVY